MKILVGYDGSNVSKEAIAVGVRHAKAFKAEIILVHSMVGGPEVPRKDFEDAENNLDYEKNNLLDQKIRCKPIMSVRGLEAGEDLVQLADEHKADEIVIGVRRRSKVESDSIIRQSSLVNRHFLKEAGFEYIVCLVRYRLHLALYAAGKHLSASIAGIRHRYPAGGARKRISSDGQAIYAGVSGVFLTASGSIHARLPRYNELSFGIVS